MKRLTHFSTIIGSVLVTLIIIGATMWMSIGSRNATDRAVERVSGFYLEELAGRRSQVVSSYFETKAEQMERAVALLGPEDLASLESLRQFIGEVKALLGLRLFAVADEDNVVYTEYTTYMGGSRYAFLSDEQEGPSITTIAKYGGGKEICLAIPVKDRSLRGKELTTCFIEIDLEDIVSDLAFNAEENGTRFSLYYDNGENLTGREFGPIGEKQNLLDGIREYLTEEEYAEISGHFSSGYAGEVDFTSAGTEQILYYAPIPETHWMITVLIRKNLIDDQIRGIQEETITQSRIQILITTGALLLFFAYQAAKARKKAKALLEAERKIAVRDALTGIGNKYAYTQKEAQVNTAVREGSAGPFAVLVGDLNGLKHVNDTLGHAAGDELIRKASHLLCECYKHSPVYRIGGDEFAVFLQGHDYDHREELLAEMDRHAEQNIGTEEPVLAVGMSEFGPEDRQVHDVFERADQRMYERKEQLKKQR